MRFALPPTNVYRSATDRILFFFLLSVAFKTPMTRVLAQEKKPWQARRVVFLNDVWLCAGDVVRLLHHRRAHLACGMDFDVPTVQQQTRPVPPPPRHPCP